MARRPVFDLYAVMEHYIKLNHIDRNSDPPGTRSKALNDCVFACFSVCLRVSVCVTPPTGRRPEQWNHNESL